MLFCDGMYLPHHFRLLCWRRSELNLYPVSMSCLVLLLFLVRFFIMVAGDHCIVGYFLSVFIIRIKISDSLVDF